MRRALAILYMVPPLYTLLTIWPMIAELPPIEIPQNLNWFQVVIVIPFYLGLLAGPGYIYAVFGYFDEPHRSKSGRRFVGASL